MTKIEQQKAAKAFSEKWNGIGDEKQHTQTFWIELLQTVYGVENPFGFITFEDRVKLSHTSFIDASIPETHVMIEQKSLGKDLSKPIKQSDGTLLTPYQQAKRYAAELPYSKRPRWIVACNFEEFRVYDMENPQAEPEIILLKDLYKEYYRLQFLVNVKSRDIERETKVSKDAGIIVGKLYDALLKEYKDPTNAESLKSLNKLCVRLVFLLYAESAGIFGKRNMFREYLESFREKNVRRALLDLFDTLSTPLDRRDPYMDDELSAFPYVNGGLFDGGEIEIPKFTPEILDLLIHQASEQFDWSEISPTIFGAVFESTLNPVTRRAGGMHYTSIENIHKVIDPLFLDDFETEFKELLLKKPKARTALTSWRQSLLEFQKKLSTPVFMDPAAGSGNFLTESFLSLRRLENKVIKELYGGEMALGFEGEHNPIKVSISQFCGVEINDFAVTVAKTALWIAESQALQETEEIAHIKIDFFPLKTGANIVEGNALRINWEDVVDKDKCSFIMGNPPFVGYSLQSKEQKADILATYLDEKGKAYKKAGKIDYVAGWYYKAAEFMQGTTIAAAFVSTNSITQGEQVADVWKPLFERFGVKIDFAHRTFRWDSESTDKAAVHVVIVGFSNKNSSEKKLFSGDKARIVKNINPYLVEGENIFVESRKKPISDVPEIVKGSSPVDGGFLSKISPEEYERIKKEEPQIIPFVKPFWGAQEFIHNEKRYCFWLEKADPEIIAKSKILKQATEKVREFRLASVKAATRKYAELPSIFMEIRQPHSNYILIPRHSSENRKYIPMGFMTADDICGDANIAMPNADLYHFGILMSNVHMAWVRAVCGRLEMRYRYSNDIVYNNFPWATVTDKQRANIEKTAKGIVRS
ncbi:MAG: methylase [Selenomonadaceae bacterium]|nr:methylase [Selenomonadaceae bacterium]